VHGRDPRQRAAVLKVAPQHPPAGKRLLPPCLGQPAETGVRINSAIRGGRHTGQYSYSRIASRGR
jgi:hypothetical protein